jgi:hypothetical protein
VDLATPVVARRERQKLTDHQDQITELGARETGHHTAVT